MASTLSHSHATAIVVLVCIAVVVLRAMGRVWGKPDLWTGKTESSETSQLIADPYTLSHVLHGVVFYWAMSALPLSFGTKLIVAILLECVWEISENTQRVIDRYRRETISLGYNGDSVINSLGDIVATLCGFFIAGFLPWYLSVALFIGIEWTMLHLYRDSLITNVIMLLYPMPSLKKWQQDKNL